MAEILRRCVWLAVRSLLGCTFSCSCLGGVQISALRLERENAATPRIQAVSGVPIRQPAMQNGPYKLSLNMSEHQNCPAIAAEHGPTS